MNRNIGRTTLGLILFVTLLSLAPAAQARSCSLHGVSGRYGYTISGTIPTLGAVAAVGNISLDAEGNATGAQTTTFNGAIVKETLSGTYSVNADCTGTATINVFHSGVLVRTSSFDVVWDNNQRELRAIFLTAGTVLTVNGRKMFRKEEEED
jgi:hypothetical protein